MISWLPDGGGGAGWRGRRQQGDDQAGGAQLYPSMVGAYFLRPKKTMFLTSRNKFILFKKI